MHAKTNTYSPTSIAKCAHHHRRIQPTQTYPLSSLHKHIHCRTIHLLNMQAHRLMRCMGCRERLKKNVRQDTFQVGSSPWKIRSMLTYCVIMSGKHLAVMYVIDLTTFKGIHSATTYNICCFSRPVTHIHTVNNRRYHAVANCTIYLPNHWWPCGMLLTTKERHCSAKTSCQ